MAKAKQHPGSPVGVFYDSRLRLEVPIYYRVKHHKHEAKFGGEVVLESAYEDALAKVGELVRRVADGMAWTAVIEVRATVAVDDHDGHDRDRDELIAAQKLSIERYFVMGMGDGVLRSDWTLYSDAARRVPISRGHDLSVGDRLTMARSLFAAAPDSFSLARLASDGITGESEPLLDISRPGTPDFDGLERHVWLLYTDQRWAALRALQKVVIDTGEAFDADVGTREGLARLDAVLTGSSADSAAAGAG